MAVMSSSSSAPTPMAGRRRRLFVGNLFPGVEQGDLAKLFARFGTVAAAEVKSKRDPEGNVVNTFAFVDLDASAADADAAVRDCIKECNGLRWKQRSIRVQAAQESFLQRLERERKERLADFSTEEDPSYNSLQLLKGRVDRNPAGNKDESTEKTKGPKVPAEEAPTRHDGRVKRGLVCFDSDEGEGKAEARDSSVSRKRLYHSSSDDDGGPAVPLRPSAPKRADAKRQREAKRSLPETKKKTSNPPKEIKLKESSSSSPGTKRKRYYSSSSDEEEEERKTGGRSATTRKMEGATGGSFLSKLEGFNSGIWGDDDVGGEANEVKPSNAKVLTSLNRKGGQQTSDNNNRKRLEALKARRREVTDQKRLVKAALSNVDTGRGSKKAFESLDAEQEGPAKEEGKGGALFGDELFGDEEDDDDDEGEDEAFRVRPQFEGRGGERLLSLQSRYAADERFKMDSRFKDGEDDGDDYGSSGGDDEDGPAVEDMDSRQERERNLSILESVVGPTAPTKAKRKEVQFTDMSKKRFDPDCQQAEIKQKKKKTRPSEREGEAGARKRKKEEQTVAATPEVGTERSFWLQKGAFLRDKDEGGNNPGAGGKFSFGFSQGEPSGKASGFSLLESYGDKNQKGEDGGKASSGKKMAFLESNPFKYDSSDSEEDCDDGAAAQGVQDKAARDFGRKLAAQAASAPAVGSSGPQAAAAEPFFFAAGDTRFADELAGFATARESLDEVRERFEGEAGRRALSAIAKKKAKASAAKQRKAAFGVGKKGSAAAEGGTMRRRRRKFVVKGKSKNKAN